MTPYQSEPLMVKVMIPKGWKIQTTDKAVAFYSPYGAPSVRAAMGVMKSSKSNLKIEKAAKDEFKAEGKPSDWIQITTTVDHHPAIRVVAPMKDNPEMQRLDYYVESPEGMYYIQFVAPRVAWQHYGPIYSFMISKVHFLHP